jgi:cellulose synthase/poly-beta-1,6-N-acetylglucosamine synthase-like glycosyltransferase
MTAYHILAYLAIAFYIILYFGHMFYLLLGYKAALRWKKLGYLEEAHRLSRSDMVPPLSIIADLGLIGGDAVQWVDHVLTQRFPELEVIIMFEAEAEGKAKNLIETFFLRRVDRVYKRVLDSPQPREAYQSDDRRLILVRTQGAERGASLNLALNLARYPLVAVAGRDVSMEDDALICMVRPFMEGETRTPGVMGVELPSQMEKENLLPPRRITRFALMESLRVQLGYLAGAPYMEGPVIAHGSLLLYRKKDLLSAGGFHPDLPVMGAEMDMTLRLHKLMLEAKERYRYVFLPQLVARRPFSQSWAEHFRQSREQQRGISSAFWAGRDMLFRARYGRLGMFQLPFFWLFINLAPVIGFSAYFIVILFFALGKIGWPVLVAFLLSTIILPAMVGVGAVTAARRELGILRGQGILLYGYAFMTQIWFRQLTSLATIFDPSRWRGRGR